MDKLKIIRPNGEEEIAELTTDKSLVGKNYLKLDIGGVPHYAKVGDVVDTHMYTFNGVDGKKYYIKKKIENVENPPSGDSPTLDIRGTLTLVQAPDDMNVFGAEHLLIASTNDSLGAITNTATQYPVIHVFAASLNGENALEFTAEGLHIFFEKFANPRSVVFKVKVGSIETNMVRSEYSSITGSIAPSQFNYLMETVGTPLDFSIKYE